jgi:hypothetical protein
MASQLRSHHREMQRHHLELAERHVAQGERRIVEQQERVEKLASRGLSVAQAEKALDSFYVSQKLFIQHRDEIRKELDKVRSPRSRFSVGGASRRRAATLLEKEPSADQPAGHAAGPARVAPGIRERKWSGLTSRGRPDSSRRRAGRSRGSNSSHCRWCSAAPCPTGSW